MMEIAHICGNGIHTLQCVIPKHVMAILKTQVYDTYVNDVFSRQFYSTLQKKCFLKSVCYVVLPGDCIRCDAISVTYTCQPGKIDS